jgi:hypothetical protein
VEWINFYENLNGISLTYGSDLFGDRMLLREHWKQAKYQTHENWNNAKGIYSSLPNVTNNDISAFIDALYSGEFENTQETFGVDHFYLDSQAQAHVYIHMDDNTFIELRLMEGGYVGYQSLGWYFVKMPGAAFDAIFNVCR